MAPNAIKLLKNINFNELLDITNLNRCANFLYKYNNWAIGIQTIFFIF